MFTQEYEEKEQLFLAGPFSRQVLDPLLTKWEKQIEGAITEAHILHVDAISLEDWQIALEELKTSLEYARNN